MTARVIRPKEAAAYLGIAVPTLYRLAESGEIAHIKDGRLGFLREDLDAYIAKKRKPAKDEAEEQAARKQRKPASVLEMAGARRYVS